MLLTLNVSLVPMPVLAVILNQKETGSREKWLGAVIFTEDLVGKGLSLTSSCLLSVSCNCFLLPLHATLANVVFSPTYACHLGFIKIAVTVLTGAKRWNGRT